MKINKKFITGLLVVASLFSFAACGNKNDASTSSSKANVVSSSSSSSESSKQASTSSSSSVVSASSSSSSISSSSSSTVPSTPSTTSKPSSTGGNPSTEDYKMISVNLTALKADGTRVGSDDFAMTFGLDSIVSMINDDESCKTKAAYYNDSVRFYVGATVTITAHTGIKLYGVEFTYSSTQAKYINFETLDEDGNQLSKDTKTMFSEGVDSFSLHAYQNQARIKSLTLYYTGEAKENTVTTPVTAVKKDFDNSLSVDGNNNLLYTGGVLPSLPTNNINPKMLVIPVNLDSTKTKTELDSYLEQINIAFNGDSTSTGWESVKSFYQKSSFGKCNLEITVLDKWYSNSKYTVSSLEKMYTDYNNDESYDAIYPMDVLVQDVLKYYDDQIDYSQYDSNDDGVIDAVWIIYDAPVNYTQDDSIYWAVTTSNALSFDDNASDGLAAEYKLDNVVAGYYSYAGVDFMDKTIDQPTYNTTNIIVDAHTYIHETGHLFGLDDYYDYNEEVGCNRGLYGASMMDYNIGDLDPYSKLLLNWIDPTVVSGVGEINVTLRSGVNSGDVVLITNHVLESIYDSYYLIEFYTNTSLNANDEPIKGQGIRIMKVNSEIYCDKNGDPSYYQDEYYSSAFKYNNTSTSKPQIEMIYNGSMPDGVILEDNLFKTSQNYRCNLFTLVVGEMTNEAISITITMNA